MLIPTLCLIVATVSWAQTGTAQSPSTAADTKAVDFIPDVISKVTKTPAEWRKTLTASQFQILRQAATSAHLQIRSGTTTLMDFIPVADVTCHSSMHPPNLTAAPGGQVFTSLSKRRWFQSVGIPTESVWKSCARGAMAILATCSMMPTENLASPKRQMGYAIA